MNKKIIAAAVAAACVAGAPAAQAEIKVYSHVQFELTDNDANGAANDNLRVTDNQRGRLGVKGGHDLGGGLKSFAIAEFDFEGGERDGEFGNDDRTTGSNATPPTAHTHSYTQRHAFRVREINAGLKGSFGSIGLGTVKSAYKYYGGVKYDPFVTTQLEARGVGMEGGTDGHNGFLNNAFVYTGKFGMVSVHATYSLDDTDRDSDGLDDDGELSLGVKAGSKTWEAGFALYDEAGSASASSQENFKVFGKMKFGNNTVLAQVEDNDTGGGADRQYIWLGYQLKVGKGMVNVQYAQSEIGTTDADMITVGYIHKFNKKSRIFAGYQTFDSDNNAQDLDQLSVGIRVDI